MNGLAVLNMFFASYFLGTGIATLAGYKPDVTEMVFASLVACVYFSRLAFETWGRR